MPDTQMKKRNYSKELLAIIKGDQNDAAKKNLLDDYHANDIADAIEAMDAKDRADLYHLLDNKEIAEIYTYIDNIDVYLKELGLEKAAHILQEMDSDDAVDVLEELDEEFRKQLFLLMDKESKEDISLIRSNEDDEIGSKMTTNFILINRRESVKQAMRSLVAQAEENDNITTLYIHDDDETFYGAIELKDLIRARENTSLESIITRSYPYVRDKESVTECLERLKDYAEDSIPVLDDENRIIGVITSQDIVEVVDDEMGDDYAKLAGLSSEEDLEEPLLVSMRKRLPWLVLLLFLGIGVSSVVGMFETVVAQITLLMCFQSMILDMAGNAGTQSLAVTIRVLMDENLKAKQKVQLIVKESKVGFSNGALLGAVSFLFIGLFVWLIKGTSVGYAFCIAGCVSSSLLAAMIISSIVGTVIPLFFDKIKVDPAVASGPLITTVNDLVAVISYYGLAWILLINVFHLR